MALYTMRVADYKAKMAVYEEEMAAYKVGQRRREADKVAVKRRLSASDADPAAPAAKRPTPVPSSCLLPRASPLADTPPNPAPPCAHPRHRRTCPPNQARRETPEACVAGSAEAPRAPPAEPLRRLPQVLREEKEAAAAVEPEARGDGVELLGGPHAGERGRVPGSPWAATCTSVSPTGAGTSARRRSCGDATAARRARSRAAANAATLSPAWRRRREARATSASGGSPLATTSTFASAASLRRDQRQGGGGAAETAERRPRHWRPRWRASCQRPVPQSGSAHCTASK